MTARPTPNGLRLSTPNAVRLDSWKPSTPSAFSLQKPTPKKPPAPAHRRTFGSLKIDNSSQGQLIEQTLATLQNFGPDAVAKALAIEISEGNRNSREFLLGSSGDMKTAVDHMAAPLARLSLWQARR